MYEEEGEGEIEVKERLWIFRVSTQVLNILTANRELYIAKNS